MQLKDIRYFDKSGGDKLEVKDGVTSLYFMASQITNFATLSGLKTRLRLWALECQE